MSGYQQAICGEIYTPVLLVLRGVPMEDTSTGTGGELMGSSGRGVQVAGTPEDLDVGVGGSGAKRVKWGEGVEIVLVGRRLTR
jgi:hypothetical protein